MVLYCFIVRAELLVVPGFGTVHTEMQLRYVDWQGMLSSLYLTVRGPGVSNATQEYGANKKGELINER